MREAIRPVEWGNREGLAEYAIRWNWGADSPGFTAVLRVKDEARSLPWVLPGVLRSVERAVVVDNGSTDGTPEIARRIAEEIGLAHRLELTSYPFKVSRCGPEHLWTYPDSVRSLTYFYNWSFSHVQTRYALKWDGDMVLTPEGERVLQDLAWQLQGSDQPVRMALSPVYVESERVAYVDRGYTHREFLGWRNIPRNTFFKAFDWEHIRRGPEEIFQAPDWMCFELKWLDTNEFSHWSDVDFTTGPLQRKRREHGVIQALLAGTEPPKGVVRVESPEGTHVVDHLRRGYAALRRRGVVPVAGGPAGNGGRPAAARESVAAGAGRDPATDPRQEDHS